MDGLHPDHVLIDNLGGPTRLAEKLCFQKESGPQRVANWRRRGIPDAVKLNHPELFLPHLQTRAGAQQAAGEAAGSGAATEP